MDIHMCCTLATHRLHASKESRLQERLRKATEIEVHKIAPVEGEGFSEIEKVKCDLNCIAENVDREKCHRICDWYP